MYLVRSILSDNRKIQIRSGLYKKREITSCYQQSENECLFEGDCRYLRDKEKANSTREQAFVRNLDAFGRCADREYQQNDGTHEHQDHARLSQSDR